MNTKINADDFELPVKTSREAMKTVWNNVLPGLHPEKEILLMRKVQSAMDANVTKDRIVRILAGVNKNNIETKLSQLTSIRSIRVIK